jgi:hypothetical protein
VSDIKEIAHALSQGVRASIYTMMTTTETGTWLRTNEAVIQLGLSRETLQKRRKEGFFREGEHWLSTGTHPTAAILWNIAACRQVQVNRIQGVQAQ